MTYGAELIEISRDTTRTYWLKRAATELNARDPVHALNDAAALFSLQQKRCEEMALPAGTDFEKENAKLKEALRVIGDGIQKHAIDTVWVYGWQGFGAGVHITAQDVIEECTGINSNQQPTESHP